MKVLMVENPYVVIENDEKSILIGKADNLLLEVMIPVGYADYAPMGPRVKEMGYQVDTVSGEVSLPMDQFEDAVNHTLRALDCINDFQWQANAADAVRQYLKKHFEEDLAFVQSQAEKQLRVIDMEAFSYHLEKVRLEKGPDLTISDAESYIFEHTTVLSFSEIRKILTEKYSQYFTEA